MAGCQPAPGQCAIAIERADAAQRDIGRVEETLSDRLEKLEKAVATGFKDLTAEITALRLENAKRTTAERVFKWLFSIVLGVALTVSSILFGGHAVPPSHH